MVYLDPPTVLLTPGPAAGVTGGALVLTCAASGTILGFLQVLKRRS